MEFSAQQIAGFLNGIVEGKPETRVSNLSKIEEGKPGTMTFLANPKYTQFIYTTQASIVVVSKDFTPSQSVAATLIRVDDPYQSFAKLLEMFNSMTAARKEVSSLAFIASSAKTGKEISIGAFSYIGENAVVGDNVSIYPQVYLGDNVKVGNNCTIYPGVKIYRDCVIGNECTLHSGVIIGSDGFGFAPQSDNNYQKVPQIGNVVLEDHVEIGSNTTIDRATLGSTIIRKGVKLDNLIQIAHNVEIGENTVIAAQTGISGSTKIGKNCMIAGQVGIIGHITIADGVKIGAQSGIGGSIIEEGAMVLGSPAIDVKKTRRNYIHLSNLDEIVRRINHLEKVLKDHKE
ncbi:MAG: UDP-3-O-(3-hydroxymyristoyl)glucosamine N-acyltransferase [Bacteroidetes bacterium]|nr:UDP-3-O-(3-hydroxymyristoyl)glucosamine N-acyltransferase [Bacteroidota bacterium]